MQNFFRLPPTVTYCESPIDFWIKRPYYLVSNLPYILLGFYFFEKKSDLAKQFGLSSIFIGLASSLYDTTYTLWSQYIDLFSMFNFISFLFFLNLGYKFKVKSKFYLSRIIFNLFFLMLIVWLGNSSGQILFLIASLVLIVSFYFCFNKISLEFKHFYLAILFLVVGFLFWIPDRLQILCFDFGLLNGRSLFHFFTTFTIFYLYKFYQTNSIHPNLQEKTTY